MIKNSLDALLLGRASHLAERGQAPKALRVLGWIRQPRRNVAVIEALRAYLLILQGRKGLAATALRKASENVSTSPNGQFVREYCRYLQAAIDDDVAQFNRLAVELSKAPDSLNAKGLLVLGKPMPMSSSSDTVH